MDTVSYPDVEVKKELAYWVFLRVDVAEQPNLAELFEVAGIPVAVAVTADGDELGRSEHFVEPRPFRMHLEKWRAETKH